MTKYIVISKYAYSRGVAQVPQVDLIEREAGYDKTQYMEEQYKDTNLLDCVVFEYSYSNAKNFMVAGSKLLKISARGDYVKYNLLEKRD